MYATIPIARRLRDVADKMLGGETGILTAIIVGIIALFGGLIVWRCRSRPSVSRAGVAWLIAIGALLVYNAYRLRARPEEALHYLEYSMLGLFLFRALGLHVRDWLVYPGVMLLGATIGALDEVIQWATPSRIYDWRDVAFNASALILMLAAVLLGLRPAGFGRPVSRRSIQLTCRFAVIYITLTVLCLANTPARADWYAQRVPWLNGLSRNPSSMSEYGYLHRDAEIGTFKSRYTPKLLARVDRERGVRAAEILDRYRDPKLFDFCLEDYPAHIDPLIHESRVHLRSMLHHVGRLWPERWDAPMLDTYSPHQQAEHCTRAYREYLIMTRYFPTVMSHANYAPLPSQVAALRECARPNPEYRSLVSSNLITVLPETGFYLLLVPLALVAIAVDLCIRFRTF